MEDDKETNVLQREQIFGHERSATILVDKPMFKAKANPFLAIKYFNTLPNFNPHP